MTFYYRTMTVSQGGGGLPEETRKLWEAYADKKNWRITKLPNGYYQSEVDEGDGNWRDVTRRETIEGCEANIDGTIEHYQKRLDYYKQPEVVKTFN